MADIITALGIIGNVIIVLLMLYRGWTGRLQWFAMMTALAVLVDCLYWFIHGFDHMLAIPIRLFVQYWMFPVLMLGCAFEAWRIRMKWLEYFLLIRVGLAVVAAAAHLHGDKWTIYRIEMFVIYYELAGMLLCIWKFRGEPRYEPSEA